MHVRLGDSGNREVDGDLRAVNGFLSCDRIARVQLRPTSTSGHWSRPRQWSPYVPGPSSLRNHHCLLLKGYCYALHPGSGGISRLSPGAGPARGSPAWRSGVRPRRERVMRAHRVESGPTIRRWDGSTISERVASCDQLSSRPRTTPMDLAFPRTRHLLLGRAVRRQVLQLRRMMAPDLVDIVGAAARAHPEGTCVGVGDAYSQVG